MATPTTDHFETKVLCPECDYDLKGASSERRPWCGWTIDLDVLIQANTDSLTWRRVGVIVAGIAIGVGSLVAIALLAGQNRRLSLWDGLAVLGVVVAALGHLALATLAIVRGRYWPLRNRETASILLFTAMFSLSVATAGAAKFLRPAEELRLQRGVVVTNVFDFTLAALLFTFPAWSLLALRLVSFQGAGVSSSSSSRAASGAVLNKAPFVVQVLGPFHREQITQGRSCATRVTTPAIERAIEQTWASESALAAAADRMLYNGTLARLVGIQASANALHLELGTTTYREFLGTHNVRQAPAAERGTDFLANPLGISAMVITRDGFLALGRRSARVAVHAGFLHTFGGMLEEADLRAERGDAVFAAMLRELHEELGIKASEVANLVVSGLVRDRNLFQPELVFDARVTAARDELASRMASVAGADEHSGIEFVADDAEQVLPFLEKSSSVAPVAEAALLLHGRLAWGEPWYQQSCLVRYGELPPRFDG